MGSFRSNLGLENLAVSVESQRKVGAIPRQPLAKCERESVETIRQTPHHVGEGMI